MRPRFRRGLTLIECTVTILVLVVGLLGVMQCLHIAMITGERADRVALATARARSIIEEVRSFSAAGYIQMKQATAGVTVSVNGTTTTVTQSSALGVTLPSSTETVTLTDYAGDSRITARVKQVTVDIAWVGPRKVAEHVVVATCVSNRSK